MIGNVGVMGAVSTGFWLGGEGGDGEIHAPEQHPGGSEVEAAGVDDAHDFGAVASDVAPVHRHTKPSEGGNAAGAGYVVEAGAGVEVMAAAGASANGGAVAVLAVEESVAADTDD
jgi:hypothetical protein